MISFIGINQMKYLRIDRKQVGDGQVLGGGLVMTKRLRPLAKSKPAALS